MSRFTMIDYFFAAVLLFSFFTTTEGIAFSLGDGVPDLRHYLFGGLFSAILSGAVAYFYTRLAYAVLARRLVFAVLLVMPCLGASLGSGGFATTSLKTRWEQQTLQQERDLEIMLMAAAPAVNLANRTAQIARLTSDFAAFSREEARIEEADGNSCDGQQLRGSCGPICNLRGEQASAADIMRTRTDALLTEADHIVARSSRPATQEGLESLFVDARALWRHPTLEVLRGDVASQIAGFTGEGFPGPDGATLICNDAEAVTRLRVIEELLQTSVPLAPPPALTDVTGTDIARMNISLLVSLLGALLPGAPEDGATFLDILNGEKAAKFRHFWAVSLFIELLCAGLGVARVLRRAPSDPLPIDIDGVGQATHARGLKVFAMYQALSIRNAGRTYFAVPVASPRLDLARDAFVFAIWKRLRPQFGGSVVDLREYGTPSEIATFEAAAGTHLAQFYRVPRPHRFERQLAGEIGYSNAKRIGGVNALGVLQGEVLSPGQ